MLETGKTAVEHGTWGFHYFTLSNLQKRAAGYWNVWSDDWSSYDYVKFIKMKVIIPQDLLHSWMISFDSYFETKEGYPLAYQKTNEEEWIHPGILINNPKTHLILPQQYMQKKKFYKLTLKPPTGWKGYQRFPEAMNYILCHWCWTVFNLNQPFYDVCGCNTVPGAKKDLCKAASWWNSQTYIDKWIDRTKYKPCTGPDGEQRTWGPFLPALNCSNSSFSAYFLYTFHFKFAGTSIWRPVPTLFTNSGLVPPAPGIDKPSAKASDKKRPRDEADIWPGDLDSDGMLKERALERIIGADNRHQKRHRPSEHLTDLLIGHINELIG